jgi:serine/threonine protein kinase
MPIDRVIAVGRQLASALSAAHAKRVVHRDLKPGNVHFTTDGSVKILDFGIANAPRMATTMAGRRAVRPASLQPTGRGMQPGTPPYMSPEQLMGRDVDERSDIDSLGVVLFELATGRRPYRELEAAELVVALAGGRQRADAVDPRVPRRLADVIDKTLALDIDERYQSAADLCRDLDDLERALHRPDTGFSELFQHGLTRVAVAVATVPLVLGILGVIQHWSLQSHARPRRIRGANRSAPHSYGEPARSSAPRS